MIAIKGAARFLACAILAGCAHVPESRQPLLDRAIDAAGGEAALGNAERLIWEGDAEVHVQGRDIALGVRSDIVPLGRVRSESWLADKGSASLRILELDGRQGWATRNGKKEVLARNMAENEYEQFGTYGLMRLVSLRAAGVRTAEVGEDAMGLQGLRVNYPGLPEATLWFDGQARLKALTNTVGSPDGGQRINQRFEFGGSVGANGIIWPREISISQNGKPFFDLTITRFEARPK